MKYPFLLITFLFFSANVNAAEIDNPSLFLKAAMAEKPSVKASKPMPSAKPEAERNQSENDDEPIEETKPRLSFIGEMDTVRAKFEDTLMELGRTHNLGYVEMVAANPGIDVLLPGAGTKIILPKKHLLPDAPQVGLVINLAEMRMYDFVTDPENPKTYPLGIGREGLNTPLGVTKIVRKKDGPSWRPTPRMRKEDPTLPAVVPPGEDNPLGTHALYLGWPQYLIHGTHKPLGVGRRVSSGCIRMYPEDIIKVFENIPVDTTVNVIKQPIKLGWIDDMLYLEAHGEDELADSFEDIGKIKEYRVPETLFKDLSDIAGENADRLDWQKIREAVKHRRGVPVAILSKSPQETEVTEEILKKEPEEKKAVRAPRMDLNS